MPISRAGIRRRKGQRRRSLSGQATFSFSWLPITRLITRSWISDLQPLGELRR